ncbi:MAG: class I SAM-dependent methyltransferase [Candidatus Omnitrophica bacterium]|nr:class I SAM-dependent methyltransferase [Candidatus Omnitrophota bacterium]
MHSYNFVYTRCNFCDSDNYAYLGERHLVSIVKCRNCGLIYLNPFPLPLNNVLQENYSGREKYFNQNLKECKIKVYSAVLRYLGKALKTKGRLLDIGCGEGDFLKMAEADGWDCFGTDISEEFLDYAKSRGLRAQAMRPGELDFPDSYFDAVIMYALLEHVVNPKKYLMEAKRVMKKEGILYLKVPNEGSFIFGLGDVYNRIMKRQKTTHLSVFSAPFHIYGFNQESLRKIFEPLGLRLLKMRVFNDGPSGFTKKSTPLEKAENIGYAFIHAVCGIINQGISIEVYAMRK